MVRHAVQTMLLEFIRLHWNSLSIEETEIVKKSSLENLKKTNINDKNSSRVCAEIGKSLPVL